MEGGKILKRKEKIGFQGLKFEDNLFLICLLL